MCIRDRIYTLEFDGFNCEYPNIIPVSGNIYAIAYAGEYGDGWLKTVEIATDGSIITMKDTLEFDTANGEYPNIIYVDGNIYAIAYEGAGGDGFLTTVEIATTGQITDTVIYTLEFDDVLGMYPNIIHVSGEIYVIAYTR